MVGEDGAGEVAGTVVVVEGVEGASSIQPSAVVVVVMEVDSLGASTGVDIAKGGSGEWWMREEERLELTPPFSFLESAESFDLVDFLRSWLL